MIKKQLIDMVQKISKCYNIEEAISNKEKDYKQVGTSQFMQLSKMCKSADCYEEIEMLMQYNIAKNIELDKSGKIRNRTSWAIECNNTSNKGQEKRFGEIILECMKEIKSKNNNNDKNTLDDLSLFFGYLFWQSKVFKNKE